MLKRQSSKKYYLFTTALVGGSALAFLIVSACTGQQAKAKPNIITKEPSRPGVVARIAGQDITEEELIGDAKLDFFELKKQEYEKKMERLDKLIVERLIGDEAKKAGVSLEDYISKKVVGGDIKISDSQYKKFVAEKHIPESQINPQIKERIFNYLQQMKKQELVDAHVAKLTQNSPVEVYFSKPRMQVDVAVGNAPVWGKESASVTIVEFSDFQCPFCSRAAETVSELKKKYNGKIKIAFKNFPLPMHQQARPAAEASLCVNEQGVDKFWKFHDVVFKNQDKGLDAAALAGYAKQAGADPKKYEECVSTKKFASAIQKDMEYGEKVGVKSTPTFFINGQIVAGAVPLEQFSEAIDDELHAKK